ncbi:MAG TPA: hypothetical protein VJB59_13645 [Bdellovibrionota bacterium]|nr:hypothetical protein [Bdellovibrionota bacterium]
MKTFTLLLCLTLATGCASPRKRFLLGAGIGAATGGTAGATFAPDKDSQGLNTLIFGLAGALLGGAIGLFTYDDGKIPESKDRLAEKERANSSNEAGSLAPSQAPLPDFVKQRLTPVVIESFVEKDSVADDGSLHEPHRVYRITQPAELVSEPVPQQKQNGEKGAQK